VEAEVIPNQVIPSHPKIFNQQKNRKFFFNSLLTFLLLKKDKSLVYHLFNKV